MRDLDDSGANSTDLFLERRSALSKSIANLHILQALYIPGSEPLIKAIDPILLADRPEDIEILLPSTLPLISRDTKCIEGLPQLEYQLRYAQAVDALHDLRSSCRLVQAFTTKSQSHIMGTQGTVTRG